MQTNKATGRAVAAYRKMLQLERRFDEAAQEVQRTVCDPDVELDKYYRLTAKLDEANEEGLPLHNVGRADVKKPDTAERISDEQHS